MKTTNRSVIERLQQSRLLSTAELDQARAEVTSDNPRADVALVNRLVDLGTLTAWQGLQLLAGRTSFFIGPYKLLQRIGQGGVATVYLAQHTRIGHRVALKVFPRSLLQCPDAVARFRRETLASVRVNHPHVVTGYGSNCFAGQGVLIMEYVSGDDLSRWLKRFGVLPIDWCCEVARQAALGLAHIHQRGLVHRDIKPSNLLAVGSSLREAPHVKVADLGAANIKYSDALSANTRLTLLGNLLGTPNYVAPEQIDDPHAADHRCDLFSLGCTLFKLLTSELPWTAASMPELLKARMSDPPTPVSRLREDVPPRLERIIETMLARDPAQRFSSADEIARDLTEFAGRWMSQDRPPEPEAAAENFSPLILRIDRKDAHTRVVPAAGRTKNEPPPRQWRLLRVSPQGAAEAYLLHEQDTLILGRARDCHIRVRDVQVSRNHCRLIWKAGSWCVEDLGSVNGTYVNGQSATSSALNNGDQFRIGSTRLWLVASDADADAAMHRAELGLERSAASGQSGPATA
jgi:serine/threonine protein kinase